jgi:hypothetical protein
MKFEFNNKTKNGINYDTKFELIKEYEYFSNYYHFLVYFFNCNPDLSTPEPTSLIYDLIIEYTSKCDHFFTNIFSKSITENVTNRLELFEFYFNNLSNILVETCNQLCTHQSDHQELFNSLNLFINSNSATDIPKYILCDYKKFEKKMINFMFFFLECIDPIKKEFSTSFPYIPKQTLDNGFPDFEYIENFIQRV